MQILYRSDQVKALIDHCSITNVMDQWESVCQFSKHSDNSHRPYNIGSYSVYMASDGLVLVLQFEIIGNSPCLKV